MTTPPSPPSSYIISLPYTGTYTVGTGGSFTSLTNPGGLFEALNAGVATGNLTINITSDLTAETGTVALNQLTEEGVGGCTLTIKPSAVRARSAAKRFGTAAVRRRRPRQRSRVR
ncbi:MAG: hypothetical protein IPJ30_25620 [Acidobacteria bacterium]|nr:hypothetical protein [Acidobacteriota bacterium]